MDDLARYRQVHLVGAAGAGMSGLATILSGLGHLVSGSDLRGGPALDALAAAGLDVWVGHRPERAAAADLVAASSAVPDEDPELSAAQAAGVPVWRRPRLLGELTAVRPALGMAGSHGKTTATAMSVTSLRAAGEDPTFVVGGELIDAGAGAHVGDPGLFVLEADEAFGTFCELTLRGLLVTSIEADHLDHYGTLDRLEAAFADVASRSGGPVVACADDEGAARLAAGCGAVTYGTAPGADWRIHGVRPDGWAVRFGLDGPGGSLEVCVPRPGVHTARNAAGVVALLAACGYDAEACAAGLASFAGVRRRSEVRARRGGITVVDDYAHHPTEIAATLAAVRSTGPARMWAVFQPHLYSRTRELAAELGAALAAADRVVVTDVYGAREAPQPGVTGRLVADAVGGAVEYVADRAELAPFVAARTEPGDLVLFLGAGDITDAAGELAALVEGRR